MRRLVVFGVIALGLIAGCTTPPRPTAANATTTPTNSPSRAPQTTLTPSPEPSPAVVCEIVQAECEKAIELVRAQAQIDLDAADAIVVADICPPEVVCDRLWAFDSIVAFVRAGSLIAAYKVTEYHLR